MTNLSLMDGARFALGMWLVGMSFVGLIVIVWVCVALMMEKNPTWDKALGKWVRRWNENSGDKP